MLKFASFSAIALVATDHMTDEKGMRDEGRKKSGMSAESFLCSISFVFFLEHKNPTTSSSFIFIKTSEGRRCEKNVYFMRCNPKLLSAPHFSCFFCLQTRTYSWTFGMKNLTIHDQNRNVSTFVLVLLCLFTFYTLHFSSFIRLQSIGKMDMVLLIFAVCLFCYLFIFDNTSKSMWKKMEEKMRIFAG